MEVSRRLVSGEPVALVAGSRYVTVSPFGLVGTETVVVGQPAGAVVPTVILVRSISPVPFVARYVAPGSMLPQAASESAIVRSGHLMRCMIVGEACIIFPMP